MNTRTKKVALGGMLVAAAMMMSYLESLLPISLGIPGIKPGLANMVVIFAMVRLGVRPAAAISLVRVVLMSILFGSVSAAMYSLAGAVLSLAVMALLHKTGWFSTLGVSICGAVSHNAGQIVVAALMLETKEIVYYFPALAISGVVTGVLIGVLAALLLRYVPGKW